MDAKTRSERALVAWAILGDTVKSSDLYEGLFGFIRPIADSRAGQHYIPLELAEALQERYGLNMPVLVMESLTTRLAKAGLLVVRTQTKDGATYSYAQAENVAKNLVTEASIAGVLERFRSFVREGSSEFLGYSNADLDAAFFERLMHVESLAILSRRDMGEAPKRSRSTLSLERAEATADSPEGSREGEHIDYLFASFLLQAREETPDIFVLLCEIAGANLVAETLLTYRDPPKKGDALQNLSVHIDAPLCMDILGVNIGRSDYGQDLARALKGSGIDVCVFLHSVLEVERVLEARRLSYLQAHPSGPSIHTVEPPDIRDRVRLISGHVEDMLIARVGCRIVDAASSVPEAIRARVGALEERAVREGLRGWSSDEGREVDVATVCDLIRLRSSREVATRLSDAGPTLATRNPLLKRTANDAWHQWLLQSGRATHARLRGVAPLALSDRHLSGLIWITQGGSIGQVSRELLVANCSAATAARRDVVVRVHNALISTSPEDAQMFEAVIMDQRAERALMDATFGDPQVVNDDNVLDLLATIRRATAEEITAEKNAEIERIAAERDELTEELRQQTAELQNVRRGMELSAMLAEAAATAALKQNRATAEKCFSQACFAHKWFGMAVGAVLTLIALGAQVWLPSVFKEASAGSSVSMLALSWWIPAVLFAVPTLAGMYEMPDMLFGGVRRRFADLVFHALLRRRGVDHSITSASWNYKTGALEFKEASGNASAA